MIVVQTPLRISFVGGGTDFPQYFADQGGCVLTTAIDRYIFVIIKERFDDMIRIGYTKTELVNDIDQLEHELVREALRKTGVNRRIEISTMGDIPSSGSGMGSSSTLTVGLLNGLYHYVGQPRDAETLAREACEIELQKLARPIGIQDQYIASYGGQRFIQFGRDGSVAVENLQLPPATRRRLNDNLMLFYTNIARHSETILAEQVCNLPRCQEMLGQMKILVYEAKAALECGELDEFGLILDRAWQLKKQLASKVSNGPINAMYEAARKAGALGGKITGAGGGGFLLLYCPREKQDAVRSALNGYPELSFRFERDGSKVIFSFRRCD